MMVIGRPAHTEGQAILTMGSYPIKAIRAIRPPDCY
jgi:hypothetical protein